MLLRIARTIIAGIGLNEDPWTNQSGTVDLTTETKSYELKIEASDFGGSNSRVLFDLNGENGTVVMTSQNLLLNQMEVVLAVGQEAMVTTF